MAEDRKPWEIGIEYVEPEPEPLPDPTQLAGEASPEQLAARARRAERGPRPAFQSTDNEPMVYRDGNPDDVFDLGGDEEE